MILTILDPTKINDWVEAAIKVKDFYVSCGFDDLEAQRLAVLDLVDKFKSMDLVIAREGRADAARSSLGL